MLARILLCGGMALARMLELAYSRRNIRRVGDMQEGRVSRSTFPMIVLIHTVAIVGTFVAGRQQRRPWIALLLAVQPLRLWVLLTLRQRWTARGTVADNLVVATNGPYAFMRHPNYSVVFVELLALPMAFGLVRFALGVSLVNAVLLAMRVRDEERLLMRAPGYLQHFGDKPRFLPRFRIRREGR